MEKKFDFVPVESISADKIIEILDIALGHDNKAYKKTEPHWRWKHLESPFGPSYGFAAVNTSNGQIASVRLIMYWGMENINGDKIISSRVVDMSTHPDYRRMGIFTTLTRKAIADLTNQGVAMMYATPKLKGKSIGGYLKVGFEMIDPWPVYIKILHPVSFLKGISIGRKKINTQFIPEWNVVFNERVLTFQELTSRFKETDIVDFLDNADQNRRKVPGWRIRKDLSFIRWRYGSHPNIDYGFIPLTEEGKLTGLAILRRNVRYGINEVVISELLFEDSNNKSADRLLREIGKSVKADYLITHFNKNTPELKALKRNFFIKAPGQDIIFLIKGLAEEKEKFNRQEHWNLSIGDIELF